MQTFLPYPSYVNSARCLDRQRLGKQRVEVLQILNTLSNGSDGWKNHPAVKMWRGHEQNLLRYGVIMCLEWRRRGYKDTLLDRFLAYAEAKNWSKFMISKPPSWLGNESFHASHRSNLLRKDANHYGQFGWMEEPNREYIWPEPEVVH